jgi:YVTN family beta-propeller protein
MGYVSGRGSASVLLVDLRLGRNRCIKKHLPVGVQPNGILLNEDGTFLFVANDRENTLTVIDVRLMETVGTVPTGKYPDGMAFRR